jgi:hypothetical protein
MTGKLTKDREQDTVDLNEMAKRSAIKEDVILRIEEGKRIEQLRLEEARHRRRVNALILLCCLLLVMSGGGFLVYKLFFSQSSTLPNQIATNSGQPPLMSVGEKMVEATNDYVLTRMVINTLDKGSLDLYTYDFYSNKFLRGKAVMTDPEALEKIFKSFRNDEKLRKRFEQSWVLIFASASSENSETHNLDLSSKRVNRVFQMMTQDAGLSCLGYWAIRAGEYKGTLPEEISRSDDEQELLFSKMSPQHKEEVLAPQRRLIVAVITPHQPVPPSEFDNYVTFLSDEFYKQNLLPDGYQYTLKQWRTKPIKIP